MNEYLAKIRSPSPFLFPSLCFSRVLACVSNMSLRRRKTPNCGQYFPHIFCSFFSPFFHLSFQSFFCVPFKSPFLCFFAFLVILVQKTKKIEKIKQNFTQKRKIRRKIPITFLPCWSCCLFHFFHPVVVQFLISSKLFCFCYFFALSAVLFFLAQKNSNHHPSIFSVVGSCGGLVVVERLHSFVLLPLFLSLSLFFATIFL